MNFKLEENKLSQRTSERKVVIVEVFEAICSLRIVNFSCKLLMIEQFKCWLLLLEIKSTCCLTSSTNILIAKIAARESKTKKTQK